MHTLLAGATLQGARVLLVGDEQQLGSVEAGRAFAQLQEAGMPTFRLTEIVRQSNAATKEAVYAALQADAAKALQAIERGGGEVVEIQGKSHAEDAHDRRAFLARRYAGLTPEERARTVLADPSRAGRQELNEQVREALQARGELQGPQLTLDILVPKGLTAGEQKQPVFYGRGDVVSFRRELAPRQQDRLEKDTPYRVAGIDQHGGRLQLQKDDGSFVIWRPGSCGARDAEVYTARAAPARRRRPHHLDQEPAGDRRRQRPDGHRHRGRSGQGQLHRRASGRQTTLEASSAEARHLEHGYAQTAQKLQGQTAERALLHAEHWRLNLINQRSFYVLLSRAKDGVTIATSDRAGLIDAIRERSGEQQAALDQLEARQAPEIARAAMHEVTQERERQRQQEREQQQQRERALQQRDKSDEDARKTKPGGRGTDLGQERDGPATNRQRDYDDDMGY